MAATNSPIHPEFRRIDGLTIRMARSKEVSAPHTQALLLSPWPESLYAFESIWNELAGYAQLTAVDLPGFGQSERRDALMAPRAMGEFIVRLADELGLEQPHVVAPDVGTAAALFSAAMHPERWRSVVVGTGAAAVPLQLGGNLKEWVEAPDVRPYFRIDGRQVVTAALGRLERYVPSDTVRADYLASYAGGRFAQSLAYVRAYPAELPILRDLLPTISTPVHVIAGRRDPVVPLVNATFLADRIPNSKLSVIDASHFIWEDAAEEYGALITSWWKEGSAFADQQSAMDAALWELNGYEGVAQAME